MGENGFQVQSSGDGHMVIYLDSILSLDHLLKDMQLPSSTSGQKQSLASSPHHPLRCHDCMASSGFISALMDFQTQHNLPPQRYSTTVPSAFLQLLLVINCHLLKRSFYH